MHYELSRLLDDLSFVSIWGFVTIVYYVLDSIDMGVIVTLALLCSKKDLSISHKMNLPDLVANPDKAKRTMVIFPIISSLQENFTATPQ